MANKRPKPEEIVTKLRQVEVLTGQGLPRLDAIRQIGVTEQTCCEPLRFYRRLFSSSQATLSSVFMFA